MYFFSERSPIEEQTGEIRDKFVNALAIHFNAFAKGDGFDVHPLYYFVLHHAAALAPFCNNRNPLLMATEIWNRGEPADRGSQGTQRVQKHMQKRFLVPYRKFEHIPPRELEGNWLQEELYVRMPLTETIGYRLTSEGTKRRERLCRTQEVGLFYLALADAGFQLALTEQDSHENRQKQFFHMCAADNFFSRCHDLFVTAEIEWWREYHKHDEVDARRAALESVRQIPLSAWSMYMDSKPPLLEQVSVAERAIYHHRHALSRAKEKGGVVFYPMEQINPPHDYLQSILS